MKNLIKIPEVNFNADSDGLGFEIVQLKSLFAHNDTSKLKNSHRIKFFAIIFITNGRGVHSIDFIDYSYSKNEVIFIGNGQVHSWTEHENSEGFIILFTEDFLHKNQVKFKDISYSYPYNSVLYKPVVSLRGGKTPCTFTELINYIYHEFLEPFSNQKQEILQCLLRTFLLKIRVQNKQDVGLIQNDKKELFIKFQSLLTKNKSISRNASDYCSWLNVSYKKLNNVCKELTNKSLKAFIDGYLILVSKQLLLDGDKNISEVSYLLGFDDTTNFTKYFSKHTSQTPSAFQSAI